jgi:hypothetical protein
MKWLLTLVVALSLVTPAMAGEVPYIAVVGNDIKANGFYNSPKYKQFMYDQDLSYELPVCIGTYPAAFGGCEHFLSSSPVNKPEVCDATRTPGNLNALVGNGNAGSFEWYVRLPREPSGEINLALQCGVLKPGGYDFTCSGETGEKIGAGICNRKTTKPGDNPVTIAALPTITAMAYPGPYNVFTAPFHLTAFRNPGTYSPFSSGVLVDGAAGQVLNGCDAGTRILLKSCMDETVVTKLPVTGQVNAMGETEYDLMEGDIIYVRIDIPRGNTVDIYCHEQSLRVMGVGE